MFFEWKEGAQVVCEAQQRTRILRSLSFLNRQSHKQTICAAGRGLVCSLFFSRCWLSLPLFILLLLYMGLILLWCLLIAPGWFVLPTIHRWYTCKPGHKKWGQYNISASWLEDSLQPWYRWWTRPLKMPSMYMCMVVPCSSIILNWGRCLRSAAWYKGQLRSVLRIHWLLASLTQRCRHKLLRLYNPYSRMFIANIAGKMAGLYR